MVSFIIRPLVIPGVEIYAIPLVQVLCNPGVFSGFSLGSVFAEKIEFSWHLYAINVVEMQSVKAGALRDTINWLKMAIA
jgi:hypothetical protein